MPHGHLSGAQLFALQPYVEGKEIHDLGCGDLVLGRTLIELGAARVYGVDEEKRFSVAGSFAHPNICFELAHFQGFRAPVETAFVSWPEAFVVGLDAILARAKTVIYLGSNFDGIVCGPQEMWFELTCRPVLVHRPDRRNTLIVYGEGPVVRKPLPEERAALHDYKIWNYDEAHP